MIHESNCCNDPKVNKGLSMPQEGCIMCELVKKQESEIKTMRMELQHINGPKCPNDECEDYDSEHPYHSNAVVRFWVWKQKQLDLSGQRDLISKQAESIKTLRTALQELVNRRERAVKANSPWGLSGTIDGTDGRYARARAALEATK